MSILNQIRFKKEDLWHKNAGKKEIYQIRKLQLRMKTGVFPDRGTE